MSRTTQLLTIFFSLFACCTAWALPSQPKLVPVPSGDFGAFSTVDTSAIPQPDILRATSYDNFTTSDAYNLSGITWSGIYEANLPDQPATTDFIITIYGASGGAPDLSDVQHSWTLIGGTAGESGPDVTVTSNGELSPTTATALGMGEGFDYEASIGGTLDAGSYWISIVADQRFSNTVDLDPEWQWRLGDGPANGFYFYDAQNPEGPVDLGTLQADKDLTFALQGTLVPEPSSALMVVLGVAALAIQRRRRGS